MHNRSWFSRSGNALWNSLFNSLRSSRFGGTADLSAGNAGQQLGYLGQEPHLVPAESGRVTGLEVRWGQAVAVSSSLYIRQSAVIRGIGPDISHQPMTRQWLTVGLCSSWGSGVRLTSSIRERLVELLVLNAQRLILLSHSQNIILPVSDSFNVIETFSIFYKCPWKEISFVFKVAFLSWRHRDWRHFHLCYNNLFFNWLRMNLSPSPMSRLNHSNWTSRFRPSRANILD